MNSWTCSIVTLTGSLLALIPKDGNVSTGIGGTSSLSTFQYWRISAYLVTTGIPRRADTHQMMPCGRTQYLPLRRYSIDSIHPFELATKRNVPLHRICDEPAQKWTGLLTKAQSNLLRMLRTERSQNLSSSKSFPCFEMCFGPRCLTYPGTSKLQI